jgi:aldose 1-epimerase
MREHVLRSDEMEVVLLPDAGGRLHRIRAFGVDLLRTPDDPAAHHVEPIFWGSYVMAPWCNRAQPGPMALAGRRVNLAPSFVDGSAIHGLAWAAAWDRRADGDLVFRRAAADDWPWTFEVVQSARVTGAALEVTCRLVNLDSIAPMPAGIGLHPWFRRPIELRVPAERVYASNVESPAEPATVDGTLDLRVLAPPADGLDGAWARLTQPRIELAWPEAGIRASLEVQTDAGDVLVTVATPPHLDAIGVEPQTTGPDPLRRLLNREPDPAVLLAPGASMHLMVRLAVERVA